MWLGWLDSNQRNARVKVLCLTAWRHPNIPHIVRDCMSALSIINKLSNRTFTYWMCGEICVCNNCSRSFILATNILIILHTFFMFDIFKRFSFWSKLIGLEPKPSDPILGQRAFRLHQTSNHCHTISLLWHILHGFILTTQFIICFSGLVVILLCSLLITYTLYHAFKRLSIVFLIYFLFFLNFSQGHFHKLLL